MDDVGNRLAQTEATIESAASTTGPNSGLGSDALEELVSPASGATITISRPVPQDPQHPCFLYLSCRGTADCVVLETEDLFDIFLDSPAFCRTRGPGSPSRPLSEAVAIDGKGIGLRALTSIAPGTLVLHEPPLLLGPNSHRVAPRIFTPHSGAFEAAATRHLCPSSRSAFDALSNAYPELGALGVIETNSLVVLIPNQPQDKVYSAVFPTISRANHSCQPNVNMFFDFETFEGQLYAMAPIGTGEEITLSYIILEKSRENRRAHLESSYRFVCSCEACRLKSEALAESDRRREMLGDILETADLPEPKVDVSQIDKAIELAKKEALVEAEAFLWYFGAKLYARQGQESEARSRWEEAIRIFSMMEGRNSIWAARARRLSSTLIVTN